MDPPFSLGIDNITLGLETKFIVCYLDDGTLADSPEKVLAATNLVNALRGVGLELNPRICELTTLNHTKVEEEIQSFGRFKDLLPELKLVLAAKSFLLGASFSEESISVAIRENSEGFERKVSKLKVIENYQALILLNCVAFPKLQYILRASPAYSHMENLEKLDDALVAALPAVFNISFGENSLAQVWEAWGSGWLRISLSEPSSLLSTQYGNLLMVS